MGNNNKNGRNRTTDRESVRREIALACQKDGNIANLFASVLEILLRYLADSGAIDLVEDDGSITRALTRDNDGDREKMLGDDRDGHPMSLTSSYGYPRVIKTGKSQFIPGVSERIAGRLFTQAELVFDGLLVRSFLCVPLVAGGHMLGALTLLTVGSGRALDSDDLLIVEEIASIIANTVDGHARRDGQTPTSVDGHARRDGQAQASVDGLAHRDGHASFPVDGHASRDGKVSVDGHASRDGKVSVDGHASRDGKVSVDGHASRDGKVSVDGHASRDGQASVDGHASRDGQASVDGHARRDGQASVDGHARRDGQASNLADGHTQDGKDSDALNSHAGYDGQASATKD